MPERPVRSWFFRDPVLRPDEHVVTEWLANRSVGAFARGGKLVLTDQRVLFEPHQLDRVLLAKPWEADLKAVDNVGTQQPNGAPFNGGLRERLTLTVEGRTHLFVVGNVHRVATQIDLARP
jgi:hypothetical protein